MIHRAGVVASPDCLKIQAVQSNISLRARYAKEGCFKSIYAKQQLSEEFDDVIRWQEGSVITSKTASSICSLNFINDIRSTG